MGVAQQRRLIVVDSSPWRWRGEVVSDGTADFMPYKDRQQYASAAGHVRATIYCVAMHRWGPACTLATGIHMGASMAPAAPRAKNDVQPAGNT